MKRLSYFVPVLFLVQCAKASFEILADDLNPNDRVDHYIKGIEEPEFGEPLIPDPGEKISQEFQSKIERLQMMIERLENGIKASKSSCMKSKSEMMAEKAQVELKLTQVEMEKIELQTKLMQYDSSTDLLRQLLEMRVRAAERKSKSEEELNEDFMKYMEKEREIWTRTAGMFMKYIREMDLNASNDLIIQNCESNIQLLANRTVKALRTCAHKASKVALVKTKLIQESALRNKEKQVLSKSLVKLESDRDRLIEVVKDAYSRLQSAQRSNEYCTSQLALCKRDEGVNDSECIHPDDLFNIVRTAMSKRNGIPILFGRHPRRIVKGPQGSYAILPEMSGSPCDKQDRLINEMSAALLNQEQVIKTLRQKCEI